VTQVVLCQPHSGQSEAFDPRSERVEIRSYRANAFAGCPSRRSTTLARKRTNGSRARFAGADECVTRGIHLSIEAKRHAKVCPRKLQSADRVP